MWVGGGGIDADFTHRLAESAQGHHLGRYGEAPSWQKELSYVNPVISGHPGICGWLYPCGLAHKLMREQGNSSEAQKAGRPLGEEVVGGLAFGDIDHFR